MAPHQLYILGASALAAAASVYDLRSGVIPNRLALVALSAAPITHFAWAAWRSGAHAALIELAWSVGGAALCAALPLLAWSKGSFGGGDVKLLAAIGALCLPTTGMLIEYYAVVIGALFALGRLAWRGSLLRTLGTSAALVLNPFLSKAHRRPLPREAMTPLRFAPAIFVATAFAYVATGS